MPTEKVVSIDVGRSSNADAWSDESPESVLSEMRGAAKAKLLGLPCARCHRYYDSDLTACPRCGFTQRERFGDPTAPVRHKAA
jgi:hypothetical protein